MVDSETDMFKEAIRVRNILDELSSLIWTL